MPKPKVEVDVHCYARLKHVISAVCCAPFDKAKKELEKKVFTIISAEQNAYLRFQEGMACDISQYGNWTKEAFVYVPSKGRFLVAESPLLELSEKELKAKIASLTSAPKGKKEIYLNDEQLEKALEDSVEITDLEIQTRRLREDERMLFLFGGDRAYEYGDFLNKTGITQMSLQLVKEEYVEEQERAFVRQLWFGGLNGKSTFIGDARTFDLGFKLRGIKETALRKKK